MSIDCVSASGPSDPSTVLRVDLRLSKVEARDGSEAKPGRPALSGSKGRASASVDEAPRAESSDTELVARARGGDHTAFGELIDRHRRAVYRAALAALGSPADAEDAAQDAFINAYQRLGSFRGDASFKTWLLTIAWNQALNRRRSLRRWWRRSLHSPGQEGQDRREGLDRQIGQVGRVGQVRRVGQAGSGVDDVATGDPSPEQAASDAQLRRHIIAEIRALSPKLRDALLLAQAGEYNYEEIAVMLGTAAGTIKWRVSEARRVIKKRLRERGHAGV
jgi:RNA polymerase sigma-70 factor (ECF subfamily)